MGTRIDGVCVCVRERERVCVCVRARVPVCVQMHSKAEPAWDSRQVQWPVRDETDQILWNPTWDFIIIKYFK